MSRKSDFDRSIIASKQAAKAVEAGRERRRAINDNPLPFPKNTASCCTTTHQLAEDINKVLETLFSDYFGSIVSVVPNQAGTAIKVELYFKPLVSAVDQENDGSIRAFVSTREKMAQKDGSSLAAKISLANSNVPKNKNFELTDEAAEIIYDFLPKGVQANVNWAKPETFSPYYMETQENQQYGGPVIYCTIEVDLYRILAFIYGIRENDGTKYGSRLTYNVSAVQPKSNVVNPLAIGANWILNISVMSEDDFQSICKTLDINLDPTRTPIVISRKNRL